MIKIILFYLLFNLLSCESDNKDKSEQTKLGLLFLYSRFQSRPINYDSVQYYYSSMKSLEIQVAYETGAEPNAGSITLPNSTTLTTWGILEENLKEVFKNRSQAVSFTIPKELTSMTQIPTQNKTSWTISEILNLSNSYRTNKSTADTGRFFIVFLNGYYSENGNNNQNVIGVNISGTPIIAIFKQVINSTGNSITIIGRATRVYVEQSTLVHEMGHALGLVNNGVPLTTQHQDTQNGAHCNNTLCVMYYANTGTTALVNYIQSYLNSGSAVMIKSECLQDTQSYKP